MGFVVNGTIQVQTVTGGGWGANGDPVQATVCWSDPVPCHIDTVTHRNDGRYDNGTFTESSYRVFFEMYDMDCDFTSKRVRLTHNGRDIGNVKEGWLVQNVQYKPKTGRIQVTV
jgi:hypothetical protein